MNAVTVLSIIADVREDFSREEDQGLLQHDLHKAEMALAGKYACDRIQRAISARTGDEMIPPKMAGRAR